MASRTCWNCEDISHHTPVHSSAQKARSGRWYAALRCDGCGVLSVAEAPSSLYTGQLPTQAMEELEKLESLIWRPQRVYGKRFDDVPHPVDAAASEAWACYSIAQYRASVLMARAVVEAAAKQKGFTDGALVSKIDALYKAEIIGKGVKEAAHEIRFIGNEMAHGDFVNEITEEECSDVLVFLEELLTEMYQRPARLSAFREKRLSRATNE